MKVVHILGKWRFGAILLLVMVFMLGAASPGTASGDIGLVIDGQRIDSTPPPIIKNDRTLVPVRLVSETLGAEVEWYEESRTVHLTKGNRNAVLRLDNRLVDYIEGETSYSLCDVPPQIVDNRTYVPLRLVSNILGVTINWDGVNRTVYIDSSQPTGFAPFFNVSIVTIQPGQVITGATPLKASCLDGIPAGAEEVRFYLLNPQTGRGKVVARGKSIEGTYNWLPDPVLKGTYALAAAVFDKEGKFLAGNAVPVELAVEPSVVLGGVAGSQVVTETLTLSPVVNFTAEYVKYEITNLETGKANLTEEMDPQAAYKWTPQLTDNGKAALKVIAYDSEGNAYSSPQVVVNVDVQRKMELSGIPAGYQGEKPVTLWFSRNFLVSEVTYYLKNSQTGEVNVLQPAPGQLSYWWFPGPELAGTYEITAEVRDTVGKSYTTNSLSVKLPGKNVLRIETVGPNQVVTGALNLKSLANVPLSKIEYMLINPAAGTSKVIAGGTEPFAEYSWTPEQADSGNRQIQAVGTTKSGEKVYSETIPVRIYLGKIYGPQPIIAKDLFLGLASGLAQESQAKTGMSAALQTAQAILETGWGQSSPVDKYTGLASKNMFGIKGKGPAGSVTSNTWEEYNGVVFRVDAEFRAYSSPEESWADHKKLLLNGSRYEPFRAVMHNSTQGAWALKRCGYATDSKYPLKLIDIIKRYDLDKLDETGI